MQASTLTPAEFSEGARRLATPFFAEGAAEVFVGRCCSYVFVGTRKPDLCGGCQQPVTAKVAHSVDEAATP